MTALLLDVLFKSTALLGAAALVDLALARRASSSTRHLVWALTVCALLALPLAIATLPRWEVRIPVQRALVAGSARADAAVAAVAPRRPSDLPPTPVRVGAAAPAATRPFDAFAAAGLALVYLAGVLILLARLAIEPFALRRLTRAAADVGEPDWRSHLAACARRLRVGRPVRLLRSARDVMPLTFGTIAPAIVLPASSTTWTDDRRAAVLLHELAHVARRDCLVQRLTAVACALYWPHPGVWWAARRLRVERELACDDRVLAAGAAARDYAGHLLDLAHTLGRAPAPATALGMARARQLERRLLAILDAARHRGALRGRGVVAAATVAGLVLVSMAALRAAVVPVESFGEAAAVARDSVPQPQTQDFTGTWDLRRTADPQVVEISVRTARGSHGRTVRLDRLAGLPVDQIGSANARVSFPIRRDAGVFTVDGVCRSGVCGGTFAFAPSVAFADTLASRGIGRPTPAQQFALAIADVGTAYLDALAAAGYPNPDLETLVRAAEHGVDADYLRGMTARGYKTATLDALIVLRDHGVDPAFIRGMQTAGYAHLSADELRTARDHGADPGYAASMAALGFRDLPLRDLINARDHGVDQVYVRDMQALGHRLTLDQYLRTRDHGVDASYVRGLAALGYRGLSVNALVNARDHGVDPAYVRGMADVGYTGVTLDDLIRMRDHGVDPQYVRRVQRSGAHPDVNTIIRMRDHGEVGDGHHDVGVHTVAATIQKLWWQFNAWLRS